MLTWWFHEFLIQNFQEVFNLSEQVLLVNLLMFFTLKCSQLISFSDNKKILLTTRNVMLDSGRYATKYYFLPFCWHVCWHALRMSHANKRVNHLWLQIDIWIMFKIAWKVRQGCTIGVIHKRRGDWEYVIESWKNVHLKCISLSPRTLYTQKW